MINKVYLKVMLCCKVSLHRKDSDDIFIMSVLIRKIQVEEELILFYLQIF